MVNTSFRDFWNKLWHSRPSGAKWAPTANGYAPFYTQYGTRFYESDVVKQALSCIVNELKKLNPKHVRLSGSDSIPVTNSTLQQVLNDPNPLMTTSEFLEKIAWILLLNYNAFIIPVYRVRINSRGEEERQYEALYPIKPINVDFIEDASGRLFCEFAFENGYKTTIPYDDVIHIKINYSVNQYMGGNALGEPDLRPLEETLKLNQQLLAGVAKAMNASYQVCGVVKYSTVMDEEKMNIAIAELERKLRNNESGFLPIDLKAEFQPFAKTTAFVDEATLKFIDSKILRNFGVSIPILSGDYTLAQYESFYQSTLEPLIIAISQSFSKKLFTKREKSFGNRVELFPKALIYMSIEQTLRMIEQLGPTGALYENEKRTAFGLPPLPELEGKRFMSLNYIDANNAEQYQIGKNNVDKEEM